jgi:hypothetical protein
VEGTCQHTQTAVEPDTIGPAFHGKLFVPISWRHVACCAHRRRLRGRDRTEAVRGFSYSQLSEFDTM